MANKFLDSNGVLYFWGKIKAHVTNAISTKVDKVDGKGLSTNDLTTALKNNYDAAYAHSQTPHAPSDAEKNTIVGIQKNGTDVGIDASTRKVNIIIPTKVSELANDSKFTSNTGTITEIKVNGTRIATSGAANIPAASTTAYGAAKLSSATDSADETLAATPKAVKAAYDLAKNKVDKVAGKGLSTNDYTTAEKDKLASFGSASEYAKKSDITNIYKYKGSVATYDQLPVEGLTSGDVYNVESNGKNYAWTGDGWDDLGGVLDIASISNTEIDDICK